MTTATLRYSGPLSETKTATTNAPAKGLFARFYDAMIEARMRQAHRELALHRHLLQDSAEHGGSALTSDGRLTR